MNPAIIYNKGWRHLVDLDSVFVMPAQEIHDDRMHFAAAVTLQDLSPGSFRQVLRDDKTTNPRPDGTYSADATPAGPGIVWTWLAKNAHAPVHPRPCLYEITQQAFRESRQKTFTADHGGEQTPDHITRSAAVAMLRLARAHNAVRTDIARETWRFDTPAKEGTTTPWDQWKFLTAWLWSKWELSPERVTKRERWREMKAIGYPHEERAFSSMTKELFG